MSESASRPLPWLLTLLQMAGVLVFAAGIPAAFEHFDFTTAVVGYVIAAHRATR